MKGAAKKLSKQEQYLYTGYNPLVREIVTDDRLGGLPWGQYMSVCSDVRDSVSVDPVKGAVRQSTNPETKKALARLDQIEKKFAARPKNIATRRIRSQMIEAGRLIVHSMSALRDMENELGMHLDDCDIAVLEVIRYFLREK